MAIYHYVTRTLWGSALQTRLLLNKPMVYQNYTTLNQKFNIQSGVLPEEGKMPVLGYMAIGNKAHKNLVGGDGGEYTVPVPHRASDAACFNHIPFVLRTPNNDLSVSERAKYALRRAETINGTVYIAYYLKRMDVTDAVVNFIRTVVVNGVETSSTYTPTIDCLSPTQPDLPAEGAIVTDGEYLVSSALVTTSLDEDDVEELKNVALILYNTEYRALVSEIAICSGVDKTVTSTAGGITVTYNEAICVQVATFISSFYPVGTSNAGFDFELNLATSEPLLSTTSS